MTIAPTPELLSHLMTEALKEAALAASAGEVPVGAVIAHNETIVGRGHNTTEQDKSVIAHAETHAIRDASRTLGDWRLSHCIMCVTLEPCTMCTGALRLARIPIVVFGAGDSKQGAMGSLYDLSLDDRLGPLPRVISGILKDECEGALKRFFESLRK